jgi:precorrin-3B C17-methyltransferase
MTPGRLDVIGLGPGPQQWLTLETPRILAEASDLVGYAPYLDRLPVRAGQIRHASDNGAEISRARQGLQLAAAGARVAVVSGGDPGVFAMAAAVFETLEQGDAMWREIEIAVHPGISAMLAAAARLGAPLGHDFCAISLSDNLKSWNVIERRLHAAAMGDFVIAVYNPASKARPQLIHDAFALLRGLKPAETIVGFARAIGRPDEKLTLTTLAEADPCVADMSTLVLIGAHATRSFEACGRRWIYTPRGSGAR